MPICGGNDPSSSVCWQAICTACPGGWFGDSYCDEDKASAEDEARTHNMFHHGHCAQALNLCTNRRSTWP